MAVCRDLCKDYKAPPGQFLNGRYASGQKRCQHCAVFLIWEGRYCPCCHTMLRTKPRNMGFKAKYHKKMAEAA